ncbi:MAG: hypothetical protein ABI333_27910 [bacterium]
MSFTAESGTGEERRLCTLCAEAYPGEFCPQHPDEPLLDPADDDVGHMLVGLDDRRRRLIQGGIAFAGGLVAGILGLVISSAAGSLPVSPLILIALSAAGGALVGGVIGRRVFKPRFARWTSDHGDDRAAEQTSGPPLWGLVLGGALGAALGYWIGPTVGSLFPSFSPKLVLGIAAIAGGAAGVALARFGHSTVHTLRHLAPVDSPDPAPEGARLCMICGRLYGTERCPVHEFEPLLDPADDGVRHELVAEEDRQRRRLSGMFAVVLGASLAALAGAIAAAVGMAATKLLLACGVAAAFGAALGNLVARKLYRPRFAAWTRGIDVEDEVDLKGETKAFVQGFLGSGKGPSWKLTLGSLAAGAALGAVTGALLAHTSVLAFLGTSFSIVLFGFLGVLFGFELSAALHAEHKRLKRFVIALSASGAVGAGLGIALGVATSWGKLGLPLLALLGCVVSVLVAVEAFRILRKIRKGIQVITD